MSEKKDVARPTEQDALGGSREVQVRVHYSDPLPTAASTSQQASPIQRDLAGSKTRTFTETTDDDSDDLADSYDWSGDEDVADHDVNHDKQVNAGSPKRKRWNVRRVITFFFSTLIGSTFLAALLVAVPILLKVLWRDAHRDEHREFVWEQVAAWVFWVAVNLLLSWYFAFFVDLIPIIAKDMLEIFWGDVSETVKSRLELYASGKEAVKPMLYGATAYASWVIIFDSIYHLYNSRDEPSSRAAYTTRAYQAVQFVFFLTFVLSVEKMLKHMIAHAFHRTAFQERLDNLTNDLKVLDHLRQYRPKQRPQQRHHVSGTRTPILATFGFSRSSPRGPNSGTETPPAMKKATDRLAPVVQTKPSFWRRRSSHHTDPQQIGNALAKPPLSISTPRRSDFTSNAETPAPSQPPSRRSSSPSRTGTPHSRLGHDVEETIAAATRALKTTIMHDARNLKGKDQLADPNSLAWNVGSEQEAKQVAKSLYRAFRTDPSRQWLEPSDFYPAYATHDAAQQAFKVFDKDGNEDITRAEIKNTVLRVYKERRFLSRSLRDVGQALKTLDILMITVAMIILFFISLSVFRVSLGASLTSVYSLGLGASFIFKNSASNAFDAVMFLFVTHPFDTGDRVFIDSENLIVKKTGLFATTFQRVDGTTSYYFNSQLFGKFITNIRRSGKQAEGLPVQVAWNTPLAKLDELSNCMNQWLQTEENRWFEPSTSVTLQHIDFQRSLEVTLGISHNGNWQDWGLRNARKTAFCAAARFYCKKLGITCHNSPIPMAVAANPKEIRPNLEKEVDFDADLPSSIRDTQGTEVKTMLGFLPPAAMREEISTLRARKTKSRKAMMGSMHHEGAIGGE